MYPISLTESLPVIAIPLRQPEPDVLLNLQLAFQRAYDGGPYRRGAVNYDRQPCPPLDEEAEQWRMTLMSKPE